MDHVTSNTMPAAGRGSETLVQVPAGDATLEGNLVLPPGAGSVVIFAHGSGSGRHSSRNQFVARMLQDAGLGTLLIDLLTAEEEQIDQRTAHLRFDIALLARRVRETVQWVHQSGVAPGPCGLFGASTGAAAALVAAAAAPDRVGAVVSRGGRPDLAGEALARVVAPTLLIVGGADHAVIPLNEEALRRLSAPKELIIVPNATHLFPEPGALDEVANLAAGWFRRHLLEGQVNDASYRS
jgi:putative phosphoribosyl transferase